VESLSEGEYYYQRNSLGYNSRTKMLEFWNQTGEIVRYRNQDMKWMKVENRLAQPPNIVPIADDTLVFKQRRITKQKSGNPVISFNRRQTTATYTISNDTTYLAVGTQDGWLYVYNLSTSENHFKGPYHKAGSRISDIAFTDDNQFIGTSGLDGRVTINKTDSLGSKRPAEILHNGWVNCIELLPENRIMVGTQDGDIIQYLFDQDKLSICACKSPHFPQTVPSVDHGTADSLMITECKKIVIDEKHSP
jgi:WD40 repeat protein